MFNNILRTIGFVSNLENSLLNHLKKTIILILIMKLIDSIKRPILKFTNELCELIKNNRR